MMKFDEVFDFVAVGSGGGAMCAALVMRASGKSVVVLEKTDFLGGTTARSGGGLWIPCNPFLRRDGIEDSFESAATYLDTLVDDHDALGTSRERRHIFLREGPPMLEFLMRRGLKFDRSSMPDYYDEVPGGAPFGRCVVQVMFDANELGEWKHKIRRGPLAKYLVHYNELFLLPHVGHSWQAKLLAAKMVVRGVISKLLGKDLVTGGAALQGRMVQACLKEDVDLRLESPVTELIVEEDRIKGVVTLKDGKPWRIGARLGVLVNAGGFARNQAMRDLYQPGTSVEWTCVAPGDTGEMIQEMMRHGAAVSQMEEMIGIPRTVPPGINGSSDKPGAQGLASSPHCIMVDQSGVRYQNECGSYMAYCKGMLERNRTVPAIPSWIVFDQTAMKTYMVAGRLPNQRKPQIWYDSSYLRKSDTVEGLAAQLQIDPAMLKATIGRFNGFVAQNRDEDFGRGNRLYDRWHGDPYHKPSQTLGAIETPPYYSIQVVPGDCSTYGGVITDGCARVLREDGSVIAGLYATGVSAAPVSGRYCVGPGISIGSAFVWAWVAANHAVKQSTSISSMRAASRVAAV
ncbi:3-oxosteroid 1-dehydrogenase [Bradyrhizobium sp. USDA 4516]